MKLCNEGKQARYLSFRASIDTENLFLIKNGFAGFLVKYLLMVMKLHNP
jgi:hypothetical protein